MVTDTTAARAPSGLTAALLGSVGSLAIAAAAIAATRAYMLKTGAAAPPPAPSADPAATLPDGFRQLAELIEARHRSLSGLVSAGRMRRNRPDDEDEADDGAAVSELTPDMLTAARAQLEQLVSAAPPVANGHTTATDVVNALAGQAPGRNRRLRRSS